MKKIIFTLMVLFSLSKLVKLFTSEWYPAQHLPHLKYVLRHKWFVFEECLKLGVPLWIAILHDWDKFLPSMRNPYVNHLRRPDGTRIANPKYPDPEFEIAGIQHCNRNKHHWQYWCDVLKDSTVKSYPMPDVYRREMLADWRGAGRAHGMPDTPGWYGINRDNMTLHPDTRTWIEEQLGYQADDDS